jgi:proline iminopeptidase
MDPFDIAVIPEAVPSYIKEHAQRYLASNGADGHLTLGPQAHPKLQNIPSLLLVTRGRVSGKYFLQPLYYGSDAGRYVVIGSKGGHADHPGWYKNVLAHPQVRIQVGDRRMDVTASVATGPERERLWTMMENLFVGYKRYKKDAAPREIPVVVLTPGP